MSQERKDFSPSTVALVYQLQDGQCLKCGNSLEHGFHRHHKDGNNANIAAENLELRCPKCHFATFATNPLLTQKETETKVFKMIDEIVQQSLLGKLSASHIEKLTEILTLQLKISRRLNELDQEIESVPPSIVLIKQLIETKMLTQAYLDGFKEGVKCK